MKTKKQYTRICPECNKLLNYISYSSWYHSDKKNSLCWRCARKYKILPDRMNSKMWRGYGEISLTHFNQIKIGAKRRNLIFNLTIEYLWDLFLKQNRKCIYTGLELGFSKKRSLIGSCTASLDRVDSFKGYVEGNVQWVHKDINWMKQDFDNDYFIKMCKLVSENTTHLNKILNNKTYNFDCFDVKPTNDSVLVEINREEINI
jgi:hypothetical protein